MPLITIRGQLGSGAPEIGRQVAARLKIDYVDQQMIAEVATRLKRHKQDVMRKEMPPSNLLERIGDSMERAAVRRGVGSAYLPAEAMPLEDKRYLESLRDVVRDLAESQDIVIRGRGSQFILKDYQHALHVLVVAPPQIRVKRIMKSHKLDKEAAKKEIDHFDGSRREFTKRYFKAELYDPANYDLVINTQYISFRAATSVVVEALRCKEA